MWLKKTYDINCLEGFLSAHFNHGVVLSELISEWWLTVWVSNTEHEKQVSLPACHWESCLKKQTKKTKTIKDFRSYTFGKHPFISQEVFGYGGSLAIGERETVLNLCVKWSNKKKNAPEDLVSRRVRACVMACRCGAEKRGGEEVRMLRGVALRGGSGW